MLLKRLALAAACFLMMWVAHSATADVIYQYTGNPFTDVTSPYTTADFISGRIQLSAPLPSSGQTFPTDPGSDIKLDGWSFTDGHQTLTMSNSAPNNPVILETNASGDIIFWDVEFVTLDNSGVFTSNPNGAQSFAQSDLSEMGGFSSGGTNANNPGTWAVVPEPSTLALAAFGLSVLGSARRRKPHIRIARDPTSCDSLKSS